MTGLAQAAATLRDEGAVDEFGEYAGVDCSSPIGVVVAQPLTVSVSATSTAIRLTGATVPVGVATAGVCRCGVDFREVPVIWQNEPSVRRTRVRPTGGHTETNAKPDLRIPRGLLNCAVTN